MQNQNPLAQGRSYDVEAETARFMARVYRWMTFGIIITGAIAWFMGNDPESMRTLLKTPFLFQGILIAQVVAVLGLTFLIEKVNAWTAASLYVFYSALVGVTFSTVFLLYTKESIVNVFAITAFSFAGLSVYGLTTKKSLNMLGSFCIQGLWGLVGWGLLAIFFPSLSGGAAGKTYSILGVLVFSGLTAFDTQKIKEMNKLGNEGTDEDTKEAIFGALTLYLDFINLFLDLLKLFGKQKD